MRKKAVLSVIGLAVVVAVAMTVPASAAPKPTMFDRFEARQTCISGARCGGACGCTRGRSPWSAEWSCP
jgi:hypothetical protein